MERPILKLRTAKSQLLPSKLNAKQRHWQKRRAALAVLRERFPLAFSADDAPAPWRQLAVGIRLAIIEQVPDLGPPWWPVTMAIGDYVDHPNYQAGHIARAPRYNLDGSPAGDVTFPQMVNSQYQRICKKRKAEAKKKPK